MDLHDPFQLNLRQQSAALLEYLHIPSSSSSVPPTASPYAFLPLSHLVPLLPDSNVSPEEFVDVLSDLLEVQPLTAKIAELFRPLLMVLMARWADRVRGGREEWVRRVVAGSLLAEGLEEVWPILSHLIHSPYSLLPNDVLSLSPQILHPLLLAQLRLLSLSTPSLLPSSILCLNAVRSLFTSPHPDPATRFLAIRVYSLSTDVAESKRREWEEQCLDGRKLGEGELAWFEGVSVGPEEGDVEERWSNAWVWPLIEQQRLVNFNAWLSDLDELYTPSNFTLSPIPLPSHLVLVADRVLLFRPPPAPLSMSTTNPALIPHVSTTSSTSTLLSLALHLSTRLPILLTSPPSAGKTHLITYLSHLLFPHAVNRTLVISLADTSLDPKSLLGNYVSSPTDPGKFVWVQGALAKAVQEGRWVVLEDIDKAGSEVLALVGGLAESMGRSTRKIGDRGSLKIPGRDDVLIGEGFALFATRTTQPYSRSPISSETHIDVAPTLEWPKPSFLNAQKFQEVHLPSPTREEIRLILEKRFDVLAGAGAGKEVDRLMTAWETARKVGAGGGAGVGGMSVKGRDVGLRDLIKWFGRIESLLSAAGPSQLFSPEDGSIINPVIQEEVFIEACDVFFGSLPKFSTSSAKAVGAELGLNDERSIWCLERRRPDLVMVGGEDGGEVKAVRVGRGKLSCRKSKQAYSSPSSQRPFALTRPSLLLLEQVSVATSHLEPVLLVGETGTGKTTAVSHLSSLLRRPLISLNLSTQTESSDLLGGFKPLDPKIPAGDLLIKFGDLFGRTFSRKKNKRFEDVIRKAVGGGKWGRCVEMWGEAGRLAKKRLKSRREGQLDEDEDAADSQSTSPRDADPPSGSTTAVTAPRKRRKVASADEVASIDAMISDWDLFAEEVADFDVRHVRAGGRFVFSFVEGPLVKALRKGDWVLLDEVNLASPETLESLACVLESPTASVVLTERGDLEPVVRHPDFRLFACMNPATDVGKKDLPPSLRSRFTEIYVPPPDSDREALLAIVQQYIGDSAVADRPAILDIAELYHATKSLAEARELADGSNHPPHYSMRTLARALTFAADVTPIYGLRRSLWEGFLMAFTMLLDSKSATIVRTLAEKHILGGGRNPRAILGHQPSLPPGRSEDELVRFGPFWLQRGPKEVDEASDYILTPSVQAKLVDLARVIATNRFPVLIQGPTSSGKTSAVEYLARRTGHRFVRINNHEHTDIQEYLGTYVSDPDTGKLVFQEGVLVRAVRRGDWIVLDELNLAPTDVLEALNRLLDDNRELVIPETQEVIRPHPHFMLFATQNPPGLYGGRKVLSRAFRNRFLEVHFDDVPQSELETILCQRCQIALSYAKRIVSVFQELQHRRQAGRVFETKQSFATLRDLFRWAGRQADDVQQLAENGYMLLAERARKEDDKIVVKETLEQMLKVKIDEKKLYDLSSVSSEEVLLKLGCPLPPPAAAASVVWTSAMQRLYTLVASALRYNEPVLLVGETGCGKTSVCQLLSEAFGKQLFAVNCHQNMETADLLGGQKPIRNRASRQVELVDELKALLAQVGAPIEIGSEEDLEQTVLAAEAAFRSLASPPSSEDASSFREIVSSIKRATALFEWHDGPLIQAMQTGDLILLDEVSLADDSVLERLNSVLEPARTLVLAEKGGRDVEQMTVVAHEGFQVLATMNPGGDYGKKELSPALRNRFTEIWVPSLDDHDDLIKIVESSWKHPSLQPFSEPLLKFLRWFASELGGTSTAVIGVRDILAWVQFSNICIDKLSMDPSDVFRHSAHMIVIDGLGSLPQLAGVSSASLLSVKNDCVKKLDEILGASSTMAVASDILDAPHSFSIDGFGVSKGLLQHIPSDFSLLAPTTAANAKRVLRGCQLPKPILLEGSPGVGKTSLITALAAVTRNELCRINLSDQTDLADLFGSDLPVEGGKPGEFAWKDAAFLTALQSGQWVLLDEMNLASQAVLEGLNAVLDHRGTVYLPELGRSFSRHPNFRIFAAQNPVGQGGGRKGLPKSFLNRFTRVYVQELSPEDLRLICGSIYPDFSPVLLEKMIDFNSRLHVETMVKRSFGRDGSPWEFNLRDVLRWLALVHSSSGLEQHPGHPIEHLRTIYLHRFRLSSDRARVLSLFNELFDETLTLEDRPWPSFTPSHVQFGHALLPRSSHSDPSASQLSLLQSHLSPLEAMAKCIDLGWLVIVSGPALSGKTSILRLLAQLSGRRLRQFSMNSGVDTMELLGSFEQADSRRRMSRINARLSALSKRTLATTVFDEARWSSIAAGLERLAGLAISDDVVSFVSAGAAIANELQAILVESEHGELAWVQSALSDLSAAGSSSGRFEWVDGELVQAITAGDWLVIENANLCNASVLDRINSLCETNGSLVLSERGSVDGVPQVLVPHPQFRLFMTLDPKHGELSRAMRNRGIEICLTDLSSPTDLDRLSRLSRTPSGDHANLSATQLARRSLSILSPSTPLLSTLPWDSLVLHDATLASLVPYDTDAFIPSTNMASTTTDTQQLANLSHLLEATSPNAIQISRHITSNFHDRSTASSSDLFCSALQSVSDSGLLQLLSSLEQGSSTELPSSFLASQPLGPMMNPHLFQSESDQQGLASHMFSVVLRSSLDASQFLATLKAAPKKLVTDLTVLEKSFLVANGRKLQTPLEGSALVIHPLIDSFYRSTNEAVRQMVEKGDVSEAKSTLQHLDRILDIVQQLKLVADSVDLNHSAIQVLGQWLLDVAAKIPSQILQGLSSYLDVLQESITFDSGGGQREIWLASLPRSSQETFHQLERRLRVLVQDASQFHPDFNRLRTSAFTVSATSALGVVQASQTNDSSLLKLAADIEQALYSIRTTEPVEMSASFIPASLLAVAQLNVMSKLLGDDPRSALSDLEVLIRLAQSMPSSPLFELVPLQHIAWSLQSGTPLDNTARLEMVQSWLDVLWTRSQEGVLNSEAADIFRPIVLSSLLGQSDQKAMKLKDLPALDQSLDQLGQIAGLRANACFESRQSASNKVLLRLVLNLCQAFSSSYEPEVLSQLESMTIETVSQDPSSFIAALESTTNAHLRSALQTHLSSRLLDLLVATRDSTLDLNAGGRAWIGSAFTLLALYVPDVPIDPAVAQQAELALLQDREVRLNADFAAHQRSELELTGNSSNPKLKEISKDLLQVQRSISSLGPLVVERETNVALLNTMFQEVHHFLGQVVDPVRVQDLVDRLSSSPDSQAFLREQSAQDNIVGFIQRIDQTYDLFSDLSRPLHLALSQLRTGLRFLSRHAQLQAALEANRSEADLVSVLATFPTSLSTHRLHATNLPVRLKSETPAVATSNLLLLEALAIGYDASLGLPLDGRTVNSVGVVFDQLAHLWLMDREKEAQAKQEAESLYRQRKADEEVLSDLELEEREFKELFPQFGDIMDEDEEEDTSRDLANAASKKAKSFIQPDQAQQLYKLHAALFASSEGPTLHQANYLAQRDVVVRNVFSGSSFDALTDSADDGIAYQLELLFKEIDRISAPPTFDDRPYDFYSDANPNEMRKAVQLVGRLARRLQVLAEEWPEQMVLQHLSDRCAVIFSMNLNSPIVRVIAALEGLLLHTADWESYANRDNSLKSFQSEITDLIIVWRRLELSCWAQLLQTQAVAFSDGASVWWFRLYEVLVPGARAALNEDRQSGTSTAVDNHALGVIALLDKFVSSSPLGQFSARLRLLRSFSRYLSLLSSTSADYPELERLSRILASMSERYALVESSVLGSLDSQRAKLETNIRDFIKLASWKDVNVHALKSSAQHTHRQLHRCIRKFRAILRQPCLPLLSSPEAQHAASVEIPHSDAESIATFARAFLDALPPPPFTPTSTPLQNLPSTFAKFQKLLVSLRSELAHQYSSALNDLAVEIITTSKELAEETPGTLNEDNAKAVKALLSRKKRAWGELLKELKRIGFSNNVRPDILARQHSLPALHSLALLPRNPPLPELAVQAVNKIEGYHFRLLVTMPELRESLRTHHEDLSTRELQRGIGFVESALSVAIEGRTRLAAGLDSFTKIKEYVSRFAAIVAENGKSEIVAYKDATSCVRQHHELVCRLGDALREASEGRRAYSRVVDASLALGSSSASLVQQSSAVEASKDALSRVLNSLSRTKAVVLLADELAVLDQSRMLVQDTVSILESLASSENHFRHLFLPIVDMLKTSLPHLSSPSPASVSSDDEAVWKKSEKLVNSFLVVAQTLRATPPKTAAPTQDAAEEAEDTPDRFVTDESSFLGKTLQHLRAEEILAQLDSFLQDAEPSSSLLTSAISRIIPFLNEYTSSAEHHLSAYTSWTHSLFKLTQIFATTTSNLALKGFCSPQEAQTGEGEGEGGKQMDGTGMGEGTGAEDVSEQIEDESQVEGLQGEDSEPQSKEEKKKESGGIEMSEDFGGELEDISQDGSDDEQDDDDKDEEDGDDAPPDEQIGDVDPLDEGAVDEKLWGDESGEQDDKDEKLDQDRSNEQSKDSEMVAKENETPEQPPSNKEEAKPEPDELMDDGDDDEVEEMPEQESHDDARDQGEKMPDHVPEADSLDVPENLDLGEEGEDEGDDDNADENLGDDEKPMDDGLDTPSQKQKTPEPEPAQDGPEGENEPEPTLPDPSEDAADIDPTESNDPAQAEPGEEDAAMDEDEEEDLHSAKPKVEAGNDTSENASAPEESGIETGQEEAPAEQEDGAKDEVGKQADAPSADRQDAGGDNTQDQNADEPPPTASESRGGEGDTVPLDDPSQQDAPKPQKVEETNPLRNLGDALKEIRRRFEQIEDAAAEEEESSDPAQDKDGDSSMLPAEVEYAKDDEDEEMTALGPAPEDQVQDLSDLRIADEEEQSKEVAQQMDLDDIETPAAAEELDIQPPEQDLSAEKALTEAQIRQRGHQNDPKPQKEESLAIEEEEDAAAPLTEEEIKALDQQVEIKTKDWINDDRSSASAESIWRLYTSLTHDLSHSLCEQLRLILEPTLATRLKGDYRTGKRLNMKKIVPYVASEFTKDKIWLRRTRPSSREYQVLLALDDSRSMAESHSVHLAYETLALVSQAMTKLEVGDIGIAKFGEAFELLHGFEEATFTDDKGAKVMSQFKFDQKATNVLGLVERSLEVLSDARQHRASSSSTSSDLWQLEIIVSDGLMQDHDKLRTLLRRATEQRVMIVFIIVDSLHQSTQTVNGTSAAPAEASTAVKNSILSMKTVTYEAGPDGTMDLQMSRYLDTFPFESYVVLRDVSALPETLSGILRQWMERVSEQ